MQIIIGADFVPTESNHDYFAAGDIDTLLGKELKEYLQESQYRIFNLEVPLTDVETPISKCGPNLIAPTETVNAYVAMNVDLLTLANNHIFDQGLQGMLSTCEILKNHKINYIGAGIDKTVASAAHYINFANKKIGIYACCEHEFGIATENIAGANPFDPLESFDDILDLKKECDYVIVLYHGGKEHYRYPSPVLQKICRKFVEKGADLVICQHSHCIGCEEKYNGGTIVYGQGNFLFDRSVNKCWDTSLLVVINEKFEIGYKALKRCENTVRIANDDEAYKIIEQFNKRSEQIKQKGYIDEKYNEFSNTMIKKYLFCFSGLKRTFLYRLLDKLTGHRMTDWILIRKYTSKRKLVIQNYIECEAHRELILQGIKSFDDKL